MSVTLNILPVLRSKSLSEIIDISVPLLPRMPVWPGDGGIRILPVKHMATGDKNNLSRLEYSILRYGTVYGPRADSRNSIYRYLKQALEDGRIDYGGTGDETREYVHVRDAARLSVDILADEYHNTQVTITGHHPTRLKDMLYTIREILGNRIKINFEASESATPHYNVTPYSFVPKIGRKLTTPEYVDMGQGLLECISEIHGEHVSGKE